MGEIRLDNIEDAIVRVIIDHESRHNALTAAMWAQLAELMGRLDEERSLRCVILSGAGEKAFSSGADISEFEETRSTKEKARDYGALAHAALAAVRGCRHPVIAEIHGLCIGGGLELALCADLRIAAKSSRFGIPAKRLGLVVAYAELHCLVETVGRSNTLRILFEGDIFGAEEARSMSLVNRLVEDTEVVAETLATARRIAEGAPLVACWHKKFVDRLLDPTPISDLENEESFACFDTEDFRIGYSAFLNKTRPIFVGK